MPHTVETVPGGERDVIDFGRVESILVAPYHPERLWVFEWP